MKGTPAALSAKIRPSGAWRSGISLELTSVGISTSEGKSGRLNFNLCTSLLHQTLASIETLAE
jgi:hypothetical protein